MKLPKSPYSMLILSLGLLSAACLPVGQSRTNVINGETSEQFSTTVSLKINKGEVIEYCGGVFISDSILLTSGICLEGAKEVAVSGIAEPFKSMPVRSSSIKRHEKFTSKKAEVTNEGKSANYNYVPVESVYADVGIVTFPKGTAPASMIAKLATSNASRGDVVYLAGYGAKNGDGEGRGTFRVGKNKIDAISDDENKVISIKNERDSKNAIMGAGDAGAPLYNEQKEVVGITSTKLNSNSTGHYANVQASSTFSFIKEYLKSTGGTSNSSQASNSTNGITKTCESDMLKVKFSDKGSAKFLIVSGCKNVKVTCVKETMLTLTSGSNSSQTEISSKAACEKLRDAIADKI